MRIREGVMFRSWRVSIRSLPAVFCAAAMATTTPVLAADVISVTLDQAKIINLPDGATTIVIGNPIVADITMLKRNNQMILTGKGYGETNLIALDSNGAAVGESIVRVIGPTSAVVVQRGLDRESYSCAPRCEPTVRLGDTSKFMSEIGSQITTRNSLASPGGGQQK